MFHLYLLLFYTFVRGFLFLYQFCRNPFHLLQSYLSHKAKNYNYYRKIFRRIKSVLWKYLRQGSAHCFEYTILVFHSDPYIYNPLLKCCYPNWFDLRTGLERIWKRMANWNIVCSLHKLILEL